VAVNDVLNNELDEESGFVDEVAVNDILEVDRQVSLVRWYCSGQHEGLRFDSSILPVEICALRLVESLT